MTQKEALLILKTGANVFLTGEPGSGKTHLVNQYVTYLRGAGVEPAITASTGIAATHIGGLTIHAWSGIGIRRDLTKYDVDRIGQNKTVARRVGNARILIIDEVSMLSARTLAMVDAVCREIRRSHEPFGGLQVIMVGDFFQLPPVFRNDEETAGSLIDTAGVSDKEFAYQSRVWEALSPIICYLSEQHRQEDAVFLEFLSAIRQQNLNESHKVLLRARYTKEPKEGMTQLYARNVDVDAINEVALVKLRGSAKIFEMKIHGPEKLVAGLKRGCLSPEKLALKIGARVMFTKNDVARHRYVNGTLGTVMGFSKEQGEPIIKTYNGKTVLAEPAEWRIEDGGRALARVSQVPLRLAWAITIHKSQGMSLDAAHIDLSQAFEYGQGYVALSRLRTLSGLFLSGLNERALEVHPAVRAKDVTFRAESQNAREVFGSLSEEELQIMYANFIKVCGGNFSATGQLNRKKSGGLMVDQWGGKRVSTIHRTKELLLEKLSIPTIAKNRGLTTSTIINHLEQLITEKMIEPDRDLAHLEFNPARFRVIEKAFETVYKKEGRLLLSATRALLGDSFTYDELRLARLLVKSH